MVFYHVVIRRQTKCFVFAVLRALRLTIKRCKMNMPLHRCIHLCLRASKMEFIKFNLQAPAGYPQPQPEPAPQGMNPDTVQPSLQEPQGMPGMSAFPAQEAFTSGTSAPNGGADPMNPMGAPAMAPFSQSAYPQPQPVSQYSGYQANPSQSLDPK